MTTRSAVGLQRRPGATVGPRLDASGGPVRAVAIDDARARLDASATASATTRCAPATWRSRSTRASPAPADVTAHPGAAAAAAPRLATARADGTQHTALDPELDAAGNCSPSPH